ncbi:hypothetical protein AALP_AA6G339300 [Arabis alpina]|uniref:AAA+ ATPase domain-containing protein n=1 Tax=Arabis alpina TaxID=50452 RepID=A0A087GTG6_ARAAL|nr:hypothetical protein AALP_AA6G339300 [Arabis alpina]
MRFHSSSLVQLFIIWSCIVVCGKVNCHGVTFYVQNKCSFPIWPAVAPNSGLPVLASGGFYLPCGDTRRIDVPWGWSGRIWARTGCDFTSNWNQACETGDCDGRLECNGLIGKPPATLIQIAVQADKSKLNFYDVSLVDGYNLPVAVNSKPISSKCTILGCHKDLKTTCPDELQVLNEEGRVVACKSACLAFDNDRFCCRNAERFERSEDYANIQSYLNKDSSSRAKNLRANTIKGSKSVVLSLDDHEEITDEFRGVKVWWQSKTHQIESRSNPYQPKTEESRFYILKCHIRDRKVITNEYIDHVKEEGKKMELKKRERKLYSNNPSHSWSGYKQTKWSHVTFEHPATFETLAMDNKMKEDIKNDLTKFRNSQDYYKKIGKAWKRGYLLYGPPGTGKSTMVAAIANFLDYDIYDLELTTVKDNTELKRLLIETAGKSIIVIEDIDCSLDLTGQRKQKNEEEEDEDEISMIEKQMKKGQGEDKGSQVTLSGLLNFIDGLWSACGGERIIVFTTNFIDKLDPALIRKGRMDKHIEMSYCGFEAFKVLAKNYLNVEDDDLFQEIKRLLEIEEIKMTPADVGENLLMKKENEAKEICLTRLIDALKEEKEEPKRRIEVDEKKKKEEEEIKRKKREEKKMKKEEKGGPPVISKVKSRGGWFK